VLPPRERPGLPGVDDRECLLAVGALALPHSSASSVSLVRPLHPHAAP
jgi:hypothetical protein